MLTYTMFFLTAVLSARLTVCVILQGEWTLPALSTLGLAVRLLTTRSYFLWDWPPAGRLDSQEAVTSILPSRACCACVDKASCHAVSCPLQRPGGTKGLRAASDQWPTKKWIRPTVMWGADPSTPWLQPLRPWLTGLSQAVPGLLTHKNWEKINAFGFKLLSLGQFFT